MVLKAVFEGLVFDEKDQVVNVVYIGQDPCYVVDDDGFQRHIPSEQVDRQVLEMMGTWIEGHEDILSQQAAKMLGQNDLFSIAAISSQLKNIDQQFEKVLEVGLPEDTRAYLGMMGFRINIDIHGKVLDVNQPGMTSIDDE
jgi:hypothetical protein